MREASAVCVNPFEMALGKQAVALTFLHFHAGFTTAVTLFMNFEVSAFPL